MERYFVSDARRSAGGAKHLPGFGNALQGVNAEILELDAGASDQILDRAGDEDVLGAPDVRDTRSNMNGDPAHVVFRQLDLARVHADAHRDLEPAQLIANGAGAVDRPGGSVECGQEAVAQRLHFPAAISGELAPDGRVMRLEKVTPGLIALCVRALGGIDDVGEDHRREHPVDDRRRARACEELLDLRDCSVAVIVDKKEMVPPLRRPTTPR